MQKLLFFLFSLSLLTVSCDTGGDPLGDALLEAARQGKIDQMKVCVENGVDINYVNPNWMSTQMTACSKAAAAGQVEALKWLVKEGADWHKATGSGENLITFAAENNHFELVFYLIELGEKVDYREDRKGMTALLFACENGDSLAASKLLNLGANPSIKSRFGKDAITLAASQNRADIIRLLVNNRVEPKNPMLIEAASHFYNNTFNRTQQTFDFLLDQGLNINYQDERGDTPLHIANKYENDKLINYLIEKGADETIKNNRGLQPKNLYGEINKEDEEEEDAF